MYLFFYFPFFPICVVWVLRPQTGVRVKRKKRGPGSKGLYLRLSCCIRPPESPPSSHYLVKTVVHWRSRSVVLLLLYTTSRLVCGVHSTEGSEREDRRKWMSLGRVVDSNARDHFLGTICCSMLFLSLFAPFLSLTFIIVIIFYTHYDRTSTTDSIQGPWVSLFSFHVYYGYAEATWVCLTWVFSSEFPSHFMIRSPWPFPTVSTTTWTAT